MATLSEIVHDIKNIASHGRPNDDFNISLGQIKQWVRAHRNKILLEVTNNGKHLPIQCEQDLGTVPLVKVDKADSSNVLWGDNIWKVQYNSGILPEFLKMNNKRGITFVGMVDKTTPIPIIDEHSVYLAGHNRFAKNHRRAYFVGADMYICLPKDVSMDYINIRGILEDPTKYLKHNGASASLSYDPDTDNYPFPDEHLPVLIDRVVKSELNATFAIKGDIVNNSTDDSLIASQTK